MRLLINKKFFMFVFMLFSTTAFIAQEIPKDEKLAKKITVSEKQSCNSAKAISTGNKECNYDKSKCDSFKKSNDKKLSKSDCSKVRCDNKKENISGTESQVKIIEAVNKKHKCVAECDGKCEDKS